MKVIIWGSRGSLPASIQASMIRQKIVKAIEKSNQIRFQSKGEIENFIDSELPFAVKECYGSNTSCVELRDGKDFILFDAGSGLREFGNYILRSGKIPANFHIFMSHVHWDHIHGFPFFTPAYIKGNKVSFYGFHEKLKETFTEQQEEPHFPVPIHYMQAEKKFVQLDIGKQYDLMGFRIKGMEQNHPGKSFGYSFEKDGKKIVYATDSEHVLDSDKALKPFINFFKNADLLIFDAQYSLLDVIQTKKNWGHSSNVVGVELAVRAGVKHYCMFHSEPTHSDETLDKILSDTRIYRSMYANSYPLKISLAYDGMEIEI